jgi:hypothetical protein
MWDWFCYDDGKEDDLWMRWYRSMGVEVRARHNAVFDFLEVRTVWREPHSKKINDDLMEIRITGTVQHRLLGFFGPAPGQFTFVLPCMHKQKVYTPHGAKKTAAKRKRAIEEGRANVRSCERPQEVDDTEQKQSLPGYLPE